MGGYLRVSTPFGTGIVIVYEYGANIRVKINPPNECRVGVGNALSCLYPSHLYPNLFLFTYVITLLNVIKTRRVWGQGRHIHPCPVPLPSLVFILVLTLMLCELEIFPVELERDQKQGLGIWRRETVTDKVLLIFRFIVFSTKLRQQILLYNRKLSAEFINITSHFDNQWSASASSKISKYLVIIGELCTFSFCTFLTKNIRS